MLLGRNFKEGQRAQDAKKNTISPFFSFIRLPFACAHQPSPPPKPISGFFFLCNSNIKTRYHIDIIYEDEKIEVINEF